MKKNNFFWCYLLMIFALTAQSPSVESDKEIPISKNIPPLNNISNDTVGETTVKIDDTIKTSSQAQTNPAIHEEIKNIIKNNFIDPLSNISETLLGNKTTSLMFSDQELSDVDRAIEAYSNNESFSFDSSKQGKQGTTPGYNAKSFIYLNSILYLSPDLWSVWINDKKISSADNKPGSELYITSINGNEANILWTISISKWKVLYGKKFDEVKPFINKNNQVEVSFSLKPNQTFMLVNNSVLAGRVKNDPEI